MPELETTLKLLVPALKISSRRLMIGDGGGVRSMPATVAVTRSVDASDRVVEAPRVSVVTEFKGSVIQLVPFQRM